MYFKQVLNERCGCASYVIASRKTREAAVIDPAIDTEPYEALLRERDFRLICQGGFRSLRAAQFLRQQGFEDVVSVKGGTEAWRAGGKPLAQGDARAAPPRVVDTEWTHAGASTYVI